MEKVTQEGLKEIVKNILKSSIVILYFLVIHIIYLNVNEHYIIRILQCSTMVILFLGIAIIEISYKKDSGEEALEGIELLVIAGFILSIVHVVKKLNIEFKQYVLISSYIFAGYFIIKSIIEYIKQRIITKPNYSDIAEIVKEEPKKKEAKRRNIEEVEEKEVEEKNEKESEYKKSNDKNINDRKSKEKKSVKKENKKIEQKTSSKVDTKKTVNKEIEKTDSNKTIKENSNKTKKESRKEKM